MEEEEDRCVTHKRQEWGARPARGRETDGEKETRKKADDIK